MAISMKIGYDDIMKSALGIATGVVLGLAVVVSVFFALLSSHPFQANPGQPPVETTLPSPATLPLTVAAVTLPSTVATASPSPPESQTSPVAVSPAPTRTPLKPPAVSFSLSISSMTGSGFSRTVSAVIKNTGSADAHNTGLKVEAFYQGSKVKLGGQDSIQQTLGTLKAGESRPLQAVLSFSLTDGARILENGARFVITISSDEKTQTLDYSFTP